MKRNNSIALFERAKNYFPGGVNSPVRAFRSVGGTPIFIEKGDGARIWDADGNEYIDFCCSWGPLILGHNNAKVRNKVVETIANGTSFGAPTRLENELADLILSNNPFVEKIRFVSSGTEAVMSAIRLARGYTGKNKIVKFEGCYHGHVDSLLVKAGSGLVTFGNSSSAGIPESFVHETIVVPLNNVEALKQAFHDFKEQIACVIVEPIPANNGLLLQTKEFLKELKSMCEANAALLIFDEVISGFRVGFTGAAGYYDIKPDICTYGKIIGGGLPVGAYGASAKIMSSISPEGNVYQAGTLSGNPVAMSAGIAQLTECLKPHFYEELKEKTEVLVEQVGEYAKSKKYEFKIFSIGSIFWLAFTSAEAIRSAEEIDVNSMNKFRIFYHELLEHGVYLGPSGYEVGFISEAHSIPDIKRAAEAMCNALDIVFKKA
jgi:glutamate-1-semialdehyde 2,1-aminomutase